MRNGILIPFDDRRERQLTLGPCGLAETRLSNSSVGQSSRVDFPYSSSRQEGLVYQPTAAFSFAALMNDW